MIRSPPFNSIRAGYCQLRRAFAVGCVVLSALGSSRGAKPLTGTPFGAKCGMRSRGESQVHATQKHRESPPELTELSVCDLSLQTASWLQCLSSFLLSAFFQRRLARKFYAAFVVDADAFDPNHIADLDDVLGAFHSKIGELGNVHQSVFAWENFHK